jgi:hypothetical protein
VRISPGSRSRAARNWAHSAAKLANRACAGENYIAVVTSGPSAHGS